MIDSSATKKHMPAITASTFGLLPPLLPAPATLLGTSRLYRLPFTKDVNIVGIVFGTVFTELNYFAYMIHNVEEVEHYAFRSYNIDLASDEQKAATENAHLHSHRLQVEPCYRSLHRPDSWVVGVGCSASLSTYWSPKLETRAATADVPDGDIINHIRWVALVVVHGKEDVIREFEYPTADDFRCIFSSSSQIMQLTIAGANFVLNILYWGSALLVSPKTTWNLDRYHLEQQVLTDAKPQIKP
ncbi:hypothetical protein BBP40_000592 [Aspergillus hancockii]|nr:hypothetical protein BBP40_000592 [Aspergillus hancockii]